MKWKYHPSSKEEPYYIKYGCPECYENVDVLFYTKCRFFTIICEDCITKHEMSDPDWSLGMYSATQQDYDKDDDNSFWFLRKRNLKL